MKYSIFDKVEKKGQEIYEFLESNHFRVGFTSDSSLLLSSLYSDMCKTLSDNQEISTTTTQIGEDGKGIFFVHHTSEPVDYSCMDSYTFYNMGGGEESWEAELVEVPCPTYLLDASNKEVIDLGAGDDKSDVFKRIMKNLASFNAVFVEGLASSVIQELSGVHGMSVRDGEYYDYSEVPGQVVVLNMKCPPMGSRDYASTMAGIAEGLIHGNSYVCDTAWMNMFMSVSYQNDVSLSSCVVYQTPSRMSKDDMKTLSSI